MDLVWCCARQAKSAVETYSQNDFIDRSDHIKALILSLSPKITSVALRDGGHRDAYFLSK